MTEQEAPAGQTQPTNVQKKKVWKKPGKQQQSQPTPQPTK